MVAHSHWSPPGGQSQLQRTHPLCLCSSSSLACNRPSSSPASPNVPPTPLHEEELQPLTQPLLSCGSAVGTTVVGGHTGCTSPSKQIYLTCPLRIALSSCLLHLAQELPVLSQKWCSCTSSPHSFMDLSDNQGALEPNPTLNSCSPSCLCFSPLPRAAPARALPAPAAPRGTGRKSFLLRQGWVPSEDLGGRRGRGSRDSHFGGRAPVAASSPSTRPWSACLCELLFLDVHHLNSTQTKV